MQAVQLSVGVLVASPRVLDTLGSYGAALSGRKMRPRTVQTYVRAIRALSAALGDDASVADITHASLSLWQAHRSNVAAGTLSKQLSAIRSYCRWCMDAGLRSDDPTLRIAWPKKRRKLPRVLKADELRQLEAILDRPPPVLDVRAGRIWRRNRRIVLLLLYAGLRRTEASLATWEDVDLAAGTLIVTEDAAKGGNERIVALHGRLIRELQTTPVKLRRGALAGHPDGRCISHKTIGHVFDRWLADNGLHTSAHKLRHTCATTMLKSGANIHEIQRHLGHQDIRTTERYLHLDAADQHAAVRRLPDRLA